MDAFKDLFQEIKDRTRNPFFSSFAIAWLFFNWNITVALLFYDNETLRRSGYETYNVLIDANQDNLKMLVYPFLSACFYVFAFPYLRNIITEFLASREMENENKILKNSKKASVKLERYIDLLEELEEQRKVVGNIYSEQKVQLEKTAELELDLLNEKTKNTEIEAEKNKAKKDLQALMADVISPKMLSGEWEATFKSIGELRSERWVISNNEIYLPDDNRLNIRDYLYNPSTQKIHLTLVKELRRELGNGMSAISDGERESYLLDYSEEEKVFEDLKKGFSLRKK